MRSIALLLMAAILIAAPGSWSPPARGDSVPTPAAARGSGVPADWVNAAEANSASREYQEWTCRHLKSNYPEQLRKLARRKSVVPMPTSQDPDPQPPVVQLDIPVFKDAGHALKIGVGKPTVQVGLSVEGKALSVVGASYKTGVSYNFATQEAALARSAEIRAGGGSENLEVTGGTQFYASEWNSTRGRTTPEGHPADLTIKLYHVTASLNSRQEGSLGLTYDLVKTPKFFHRIAELAVAVEGQIAAPFHLTHVYSYSGESGIDPRDVQRASRLLPEPLPCPHCVARGELKCQTCQDVRSITCTKCRGQRQHTCERCAGGGKVGCGNCDRSGQVRCWTCRGTGHPQCGRCGGSGSVTSYQSVTRTRQQPVLDSAGFDANGNPSYSIRYETQTYEEQVATRVDCGSCGGSGSGSGSCDSCGGDGWVSCGGCGGAGMVVCGRCAGSGKQQCGKCDGTGTITCPTCRGKPILCPMCKGNKSLGAQR